MTDDHTFYLQTHWDQCDIPLNLRDPNYLCTYPHRSLWFCSKNKKSLSSTNTASCVLDSSLFQYLSVSLSRLLPIYRDTQVSQWTRIRDRGKSHVSPRYLLQLPFNAKLVKSGLLIPAPSKKKSLYRQHCCICGGVLPQESNLNTLT